MGKPVLTASRAKNGHHDTTIHEVVNPAVYHETVTRTEHEELQTVVDRELNQDHFHRTIQPITDSETLEEQHTVRCPELFDTKGRH